MTNSLPELYEARFDEREVSQKDAVWREIVAYLRRYIDPDAPVLDLACDRGHFIRFVEATRALGDGHPGCLRGAAERHPVRAGARERAQPASCRTSTSARSS